jgi:hypothetical protein
MSTELLSVYHLVGLDQGISSFIDPRETFVVVEETELFHGAIFEKGIEMVISKPTC